MSFSRDNTIAVYGFLIMSAIGIFFAFKPKLLNPLDALLNISSTEALVHKEYYVHKSGSRITGYNITYDFMLNGQSYSGNSAMDELPGEKVLVYYNKNLPEVNDVNLASRFYFDIGIFALLSIVFIASILLLFLTRSK